jgi:hypothetical protein
MAKKITKNSTPRSKSLKPKPMPFETGIISEETFRNTVVNGLSDALLGMNSNAWNGLPFGPNQGTPITQVTTMQINLRYYFISNFRQMLSQAYCEKGLIRTACRVPVEDALRGGFEIISKQLSPDQIKDIQNVMETEGDLLVEADALTWNRLFGGAGTLIITNQDFYQPLNVQAIRVGDPLEFRAVDMWELYWTKQNTDDYSLAIDAQNLDVTDYYDYYGREIHRSRVLKKIGVNAPSFLRPRLHGWGLSICESMIDSINQYLKTNNLIFEVLDEFKVDVYKMKNLANTLLAATGTQTVRNRVAMANQLKNYNHAIVMDSEDDFIQKELTFAGIAETMDGIRKQVASDLRMPLTKLFGISAAGFNSGEDDIEVYNAMIESQIRSFAKKDLLRMVQLRCQQQYGMIPTDLCIEFEPLRVLSAEQEENVKTQKFNRLLAAKTSGEISSLEFRDACNKDSLLSIQLDTDEQTLALIDEEKDAQADQENEEGAPKSKGKEGSSQEADEVKQAKT